MHSHFIGFVTFCILGKICLLKQILKILSPENLFIILFSASYLSRVQIQNDKTRTVSFCRRTEAGTRKFFVGVRLCYRMGRSRRRDLCDWFERSGVTVQGSALSPGVSAPPGIHLPSKRRCPKDLYKFACRILADILTNDRCGGYPVASVVARFVSAPASPDACVA